MEHQVMYYHQNFIIIDSICNRDEGAQQMIIKHSIDSDFLTVPLDLTGCMVHSKRLNSIER
jgi:hypothetical protein